MIKHARVADEVVHTDANTLRKIADASPRPIGSAAAGVEAAGRHVMFELVG